MKPNHSPLTLEDYCKGNAINAKKLISLVRQNEVLYNKSAVGHTDKYKKMKAWEWINTQIFPEYASLSEDFKVAIRLNVRRRWKKLRDTISAEARKSVTVEEYLVKRASPLISALEFLMPHIQTEHCSKLADALGLRGDLYTPCNTTFDGHEEDPNAESFNNLIDLTDSEERSDIKPEIFDLSSDDSSDYPELPDLPVVTASQVICTPGNSAATNMPAPGAPEHGPQRSKRPRLDETDTQTKILELLTHKVAEEDEDRMFLLSMVSAMKRVPQHKKIQVKSEITAAIASFSA